MNGKLLLDVARKEVERVSGLAYALKDPVDFILSVKDKMKKINAH